MISLGIGIGIIYWFIGQMSDSDKQNVINDIKRANYFWVAVPPLLGFVSNYFRSQRWRLLLRPLGYNPSLFNTFFSVMIMYFLNLFFPRLGEVSRCGVLARYENVPLDKAIGTMVLERLMDVLCLGIIILILIATQADKFWLLYNQIMTNSKATFGDIIDKYAISATVKYTVFGSVLLLIILFIAYRIRKTGIDTLVGDIRERVVGLIKGIISIKDIGNPLEFIFHTVMIWVCYFTMAYVAFFTFPETAGLPLMAGFMCLAFSAVAFSLTPGGLGLYPIFIKIILGLYGVTGSVAISLGWVTWSAQTAGVLITGVLSLALLAIFNREPSLKEVSPKT